VVEIGQPAASWIGYTSLTPDAVLDVTSIYPIQPLRIDLFLIRVVSGADPPTGAYVLGYGIHLGLFIGFSWLLSALMLRQIFRKR
jgi:hypothetical protein